MRRVVLLLATMVVALITVAGVSSAKPHDTGRDVVSRPLESVDTSVPTQGLMAPVPTEDGKIKAKPSSPADPAEQGVAATQAKWLTGTSSSTHYMNPFTNQLQWLTTEFVSYWGTEDGTTPRSGSFTGARSPLPT